jgi:hypothetical protein
MVWAATPLLVNDFSKIMRSFTRRPGTALRKRSTTKWHRWNMHFTKSVPLTLQVAETIQMRRRASAWATTMNQMTIHQRHKDLNMQPLPKENEKKYPQENEKYFLNKCYVRKDKFPLELFMVLGNITSTNTEEDYDISFPELYEIYK